MEGFDKKAKVLRSGRIREQLIQAFVEKVIQNDCLKEAEEAKVVCLQEIFPLMERSPTFSVESWLEDPHLASFFESESVQVERTEFYVNLYRMGRQKGLALKEYENWNRPIDQLLREDNILFLVNHPNPEIIIKACEVLQHRFTGSPTFKDEQSLLILLQKSVLAKFDLKKIIPFLLPLLEAYMKGNEGTFIYSILDVCFQHPSKVIREKVVTLFPFYLASQSAGKYACILKCLQSPFSNLGRYVFKILIRHRMYEAFSPDILDELFVTAIMTQVWEVRTYESFDLFYRYYLKFGERSAEKKICFEAFGKFVLTLDKSHLHKCEKFFVAFAMLAVKEFPELKKVETVDLSKNLISDLQQHHEKLFAFAEGIFGGITLDLIKMSPDRYVILSMMGRMLHDLFCAFEANMDTIKANEYLQIIHDLMDKYFYCYLFDDKMHGHDFHALLKDVNRFHHSIFFKLHVFFFREDVSIFSEVLQQSQKIKIVTGLIELLATHPNHPKAICLDIFEKFGVSILKFSPIVYIQNLQVLLKHFTESDNALVNTILIHLKDDCWANSLEDKLNLIEQVLAIYLEHPMLIQVKKSLLIMNQYEQVFFERKESYYIACIKAIVKRYDIYRFLNVAESQELSARDFVKFYVCMFGKWPSFSYKNSDLIGAEERTDIVIEILHAFLKEQAQEALLGGILLLKEFGQSIIQRSISSYVAFFEAILDATDRQLFSSHIKDTFLRHVIFNTKEQQIATIGLLQKILKFLYTRSSLADFLENGIDLLRQSLLSGLFHTEIPLFYKQMHVFGSKMLIAMQTCEPEIILSIYKSGFFPLLFFEMEKQWMPPLDLRNKILRIEEITYWMNQFSKAFSLSENSCQKAEFIRSLKVIGSFKGKEEMNREQVEKHADFLEKKLLLNLISLSVSSKNARFPVFSSFYLLQFVQEVLQGRSLEDRVQYGYQLLYECYSKFWTLLERNVLLEFKGSPLIEIFGKIFFCYGGKFQDFYGCEAGMAVFSKLASEITHVMIRSREHLGGGFDVTQLRRFYLELIGFICDANNKKAFKGRPEELYRLVNLTIEMLRKENPRHFQTDNPSINLFFRSVVLMATHVQQEAPKLGAFSMLAKLVAFFVEIDNFQLCLPSLKEFVYALCSENLLHQSKQIWNVMREARGHIRNFSSFQLGGFYTGLIGFLHELNEIGVFKGEQKELNNLLEQSLNLLTNELPFYMYLEDQDAKVLFQYIAELIASPQTIEDVSQSGLLLKVVSLYIKNNQLKICLPILRDGLRILPIFEKGKVMGFKKLL